jgi:hypothetical protein
VEDRGGVVYGTAVVSIKALNPGSSALLDVSGLNIGHASAFGKELLVIGQGSENIGLAK